MREQIVTRDYQQIALHIHLLMGMQIKYVHRYEGIHAHARANCAAEPSNTKIALRIQILMHIRYVHR